MVAKSRKTKGQKGKKLRTIDRKPIRPLERQRMRPWLIELLNSDRCDQLMWMSRSDQTFKVHWKHAAGQTFDPENDASLFELWARHTGKYYTGDKPDPKKWKANFRCALNSLPDVDEDRQQGVKKGDKAFKVYKFLEERKQKKEKKIPVTSRLDCPSEDDSEDDFYRPNYKARGTRSRPKQAPVVQHTDLDSDGSEARLSPGPMDWDSNSPRTEQQEERSPLPKFDELYQTFSQPIDKSFPAIERRLLETHSPQVSDDNGQPIDTSFPAIERRLPETHSPQVSDDNDDERSNGSSPTDEEIVDTISDMMTEQPAQFWSLLSQEAPEMYIDSTDSMCGPSVIVETESQYEMQDYNITSLDYSQL